MKYYNGTPVGDGILPEKKTPYSKVGSDDCAVFMTFDELVEKNRKHRKIKREYKPQDGDIRKGGITMKTYDNDIEKCYYEEQSGTFHTTLKAAKRVAKFPSVYRCWKRGNAIIGKAPVFCYGVSCGKIKDIDTEINSHLEIHKEG